MFPLVYTQEPSKPSGGPTPGARVLLLFGISEFDLAVHGDELSNLGIYNPRDVCGNPWPKWKCKGSQHARGAALDAGVPLDLNRWPNGHPEGLRWAEWLVTHHAVLGVQEVIWAERRWHNGLGVIPHANWPRYSGRSKHYDHVHAALNAAAAEGLTIDIVHSVWTQEDDDMYDAKAREEVVGRLDGIRTAVDELFKKAVGNEETLAAVFRAIDELDDNKPGGLTKADVREAVADVFRKAGG